MLRKITVLHEPQMLQSFPLKHGMRQSQNRYKHAQYSCGNGIKKAYWYKKWYRNSYKHYSEPFIAKCKTYNGKYGWMILYDGVPCTGPFESKVRCVGWYLKDGR